MHLSLINNAIPLEAYERVFICGSCYAQWTEHFGMTNTIYRDLLCRANGG